MDNPFAYLRKFAGMSQKEFCETYGFAKQTVIGIEAGTYPELSDRMITSLGKACYLAGVDAQEELYEHYGVGTLDEAYRNWVVLERRYAAERLNDIQPVESVKLSPFAYLIQYAFGSTQGFAKSLKVPPATVTRYARGLQRNMPLSIERALHQIGYPYLPELKRLHANWVDNRTT